jgi:hypothetical protein
MVVNEGSKTPEEYFAEGREWLVKAERIAKEYEDEETFDKSANLAVLAMASTFLGICAQFIRDQEG